MTHELNNLGVLVTRPRDQAQELLTAISQRGGRALLFPTIEITEPHDQNALPAAIADLAQTHLAIFVSANAVAKPLQLIKQHFGKIPEHLLMAAIGAGTARCLRDAGIAHIIYPTSTFNSEALLKLPELQNVTGKKVTIFCGENSRELLPQTLRARGAIVTQAYVYRRALPTVDLSDVLANWQQGKINVVVITSNEGLQNLYALLKEAGCDQLMNTSLIVTGGSMLEFAHRLGFCGEILVAANAGTHAIIEALQKYNEAKNMRNQVDEPVTSAAGTTVEPPAEPVISPIMVTKKNSSYAGIVGSIAIILAIITVIFTIFSQRELQQQSIAQSTVVAQSLNQLQTALTLDDATVQKNHDRITDLQQQVAELRQVSKAQQALLQRLLRAQPDANDVAVLGQISYLLQLASDNLQFARQPLVVIALLQEADQRLAAAVNPKLIPLRAALHHDILALRAAAQVDTETLALKLTALSDSVMQLSLTLPNLKFTPAATSTATSAATTWKEKLQHSVGDLEKLVVIRYHDKPVEPLMPPEQQGYLKRNVQLLLEEARWALLQQQQKLYQDNLKQVTQLVTKYFAPNNAATASFLKTLQELQQQNIAPQLPDINQSLQALQLLHKTLENPEPVAKDAAV